MSAVNVQKLCESAQERLKTAVKRVETFLNEHALPQLAADGNEESVLFYKGFLSDLRHVLVFSEVSYEKLGVALRRANFDVDFAEKALYNVYHDCVNSFFIPKMKLTQRMDVMRIRGKMLSASVKRQCQPLAK